MALWLREMHGVLGLLGLLPALCPLSAWSFVLPIAVCLPPGSRALQEEGKPIDVLFQALGSALCQADPAAPAVRNGFITLPFIAVFEKAANL